MVLGACSTLHTAFRYLLQERKGLPSPVETTPGSNQPLHEVEKSSMVPALRSRPTAMETAC
jgi:hypothetical protein